MTIKDPTLVVLDFIQNNWDTTNTSISYTPEQHTGWHDNSATKPQITVSTPNEQAQGGNTTPFSGFDPTGAGPTQEITGNVVVNCWSDREVEPNVNPKKLVFEFKEEVARIVQNNATTRDDYRFIGYAGADFLVETDVEPVTYREEVTVRYGYARGV